MRFKHFVPVLLIVLASGFFPACNDDDDEEEEIGNWVRMSDFDGVARGNATSFVIGNKGYLLGGWDGKGWLNDLWEYDMEANYWVKKSDLPGSVRTLAVAFSIGNKAYIGTGYDGLNYLKDFWEYDPSADAWTRKSDFIGSARYGAVGFSMNGSGYIGCGFEGNHLKDFYVYDPVSDNWSQLPFSGSKRVGASSFEVDGNIYLIGGINNQQYVYDFWMFDGTNWVQKRDIANTNSDEDYDDDYYIVRAYGTTFTINSLGYYSTGESGSLLSTTWEYYPINDIWIKKTGFEGVARTGAVAFSFGNKGFIATGRSSSYRFDDLYEFMPLDEYYEYD